jgi:ATP/maltotriose-dependent transcriptional regulator MalT
VSDERFSNLSCQFGEKFEYLEHANLFIVPLTTGGMVSLSPPFRLINQQLLLPNQKVCLSPRYLVERHQYLDEAIRHAFAAGDARRAAALIETVAETTLMR